MTLHILKEVYTFLKQLFEILIENSSETNMPIIVNEIEKERKNKSEELFDKLWEQEYNRNRKRIEEINKIYC